MKTTAFPSSKISISNGQKISTCFDEDGNICSIRRSNDPDSLHAPSIAGIIDHTLLKPDATESQVNQLCKEALQLRVASVCVNPYWVPFCVEQLKGQIAITTVVGFPLGSDPALLKATEAEQAIQAGAQEIDMVMNVGALKSGNLLDCINDIRAVVRMAHRYEALLKVIIETCLLSDEEKITACLLVQQAGADFVKTSTGFSGPGATVEDVALMRRTVGPQMGVKAAGGIRNYADALKMVAAGATRLGTSAGMAIVKEEMASREQPAK